MKRMHLVARVPNEGARRLAWWLGEQRDGSFDRLARAARIEVGDIDRYLSGELIPGGVVGYRISQATDHAVIVADWRDEAHAGWFDRPAERQYRAAA